MRHKLIRYKRLDLLADSIIGETVRRRGTTYAPPHFPAEAFGRYVVGVGGGDTVPIVDVSEIERTCRRYLEAGRPFETWFEAGRIYFNFVEFFDEVGAALERAKACDQVAIYDLVEEKCIFVD